jgi:uncharacterized tellurite resistance protein B-like protein
VFEVACPHCGAKLAFEEQSARHKTKCAACLKKFTIPKPPRPRGTSWFAIFCWSLVLLIVAGGVASIWMGIHWALFFVAVFVFGVCAESPALRRQILKGIEKLESWRKSQLVSYDEQPLKPQNPAGGTRSLAEVQFFGPDARVVLNRCELRGPLVYAITGLAEYPFDPSLIEFELPVARPVAESGVQSGQDPAGWTTYRALNPFQRSAYLDWLAAGRRKPEVAPAYVALYVQGLERRVLVDGQDHQAIAAELLGLMTCYGNSFVVRRDLSALLWLTIQLSCDAPPVSQELVEYAVRQTQEWNETLFRYCLAAYAQSGWNVAPELARLITGHNPKAIASVVQQRHAEKFRALFEKRFEEAFPEGLRFSLSGRPEKIEYVIVNPSLMRLTKTETRLRARQRVSTDDPQLQTLITLWGRCTNELKAYDRAHRAADQGQLTTEMWEALPEIARQDEHPEAEAWTRLIQQGLQQTERPLVRIADLAAVKKMEQRGRLTKKQTEQLLTTAYHLRLAVEPDARMLGRNYAWDEMVALFPRRDDAQEDLATYQAASIMLRLGMHIAVADGQIDEHELLRITSNLLQQFQMTDTSSERLEHLRYALINSPISVGTLEKSLAEKLNTDQRQLIGEFLVGVAGADGTISPEELKALKKAWQALGLEQKTLDALLHVPQIAEPETNAVSSDSIVLDQDRIAQIMQDTQRVAEMLRSAMGDEEEESELELAPVRVAAPITNSTVVVAPEVISNTATQSTVPAKTTEAPVSDAMMQSPAPAINQEVEGNAAAALWSGLPPRYHPFLQQLLQQAVWDRKSLDQIARSQGLMLGGALEAINETFFETTGDWLITEEGDEVHVQKDQR